MALALLSMDFSGHLIWNTPSSKSQDSPLAGRVIKSGAHHEQRSACIEAEGWRQQPWRLTQHGQCKMQIGRVDLAIGYKQGLAQEVATGILSELLYHQAAVSQTHDSQSFRPGLHPRRGSIGNRHRSKNQGTQRSEAPEDRHWDGPRTAV